MNQHRGTAEFPTIEKELSRRLDVEIGRNLATHRTSISNEISSLDKEIAAADPIDALRNITLIEKRNSRARILTKVNSEISIQNDQYSAL